MHYAWLWPVPECQLLRVREDYRKTHSSFQPENSANQSQTKEHENTAIKLKALPGSILSIPYSLVQICSAALKRRLDRRIGFYGKGLVQIHAEPLLLPLGPIADCSVLQQVLLGSSEMGIEQAETQENRPKCSIMPPEKQTQFKDETRTPSYRKISKEGFGRETSKQKHRTYI